jgi:integrase
MRNQIHYSKYPQKVKFLPAVIPIHDKLMAHLEKMKNTCPSKQVCLFESDGKPFSVWRFYEPFRNLLDRLGIRGCIHSLKHTFASLLVQKTKNIYVVQRLLGHSDIRNTERYAYLRNDDLAEAVKVLENNGTTTEPSKNRFLKIA